MYSLLEIAELNGANPQEGRAITTSSHDRDGQALSVVRTFGTTRGVD